MKQMATTMSLSSLIIDDGNTAVLEPEGGVLQTPGRLRDKFGRAITDLRVSVTDRCNYKCVYCRTGNEGAQYTELPIADYMRMVRLFVSLGVEKVRLTGGGPLLGAGPGGGGAGGSAAGDRADYEWTSAGRAGAAAEGCGAEPRDRQHGCGGCGDVCGDYAGSAKLRQSDGGNTQ